jgi:predicted dehydrogenase
MRLLIIGTGRMAENHAKHLSAIPGVTLAGGVDVNEANLATFCDKFSIDKRFSKLADALAWGEFDAVTNVTPDSVHHSSTMAVITAGKPVFCEKPLATDYGKATEMTEAVEKAGLINMVNLSYRNVAELHKAREIIAQGTIGKVKHIEASYLQHWVATPNWSDPKIEGPWLWRLSKGHGSNGTLGDIGIHIIDFTTFAIGAEIASMTCRLQAFSKVPGDRLGDYVLDANDSFIISAEFSNGAIGTIHSSRWAAGHSNDQRLRAWGEKGGLELSHGHWGSLLRLCVGEDVATGTWREIAADPVPTNYQRFAEAVRTGVQSEPSFRHAAALQKVLDLALAADLDRKEHRVI